MSITYELLKSWKDTKGNVNSLEDILSWVERRNKELKVEIKKVDFSYKGFWHYDETNGYIRNSKNSFFQIAGIQEILDDQIVREQPIILQKEIGYLGIICKMIDGKLNFLMQAKVEPGNVNVIQISPTIQATKSNFSQKHGGNAPAYLEFFEKSNKYTLLVDQLQSEQASRFLGKRNRNIVLFLDEDAEIEILPSHMWMTLGQIKECMKIKNLVNMDTRTVLSCLPIYHSAFTEEEKKKVADLFSDPALCKSMLIGEDCIQIHRVFNCINDYKMYHNENYRLVPLKSLKNWEMLQNEICCKTFYDFKIIYCYIEIEGREVRYWEQPLFEATGMALFGIFTTVDSGIRKYLVKVRPEIGSFDGAELGPVVQIEPANPKNQYDVVETRFIEQLEQNEGVVFDNILSEEGGRFYHEQNRNVILQLESVEELGDIPDSYFWLDYSTLNHMIQFNNCVNIQLRNLLSVIEI